MNIVLQERQMKLKSICLLTGIFASLSSWASEPPAGMENAFQSCEDEGNMAYSMARQYMLFPKTGEDFLKSASEDSFGKELATDFKRLLAAGKINHYSDFAAERLSECIKKEGADPTPFQNGIRVCYARTDIAFFLHTEGSKAASKEQLVLKVRKILVDPDIYPDGVMDAVANLLYPPKSMDVARLASRTILRSCLARAEMVEAVK